MYISKPAKCATFMALTLLFFLQIGLSIVHAEDDIDEYLSHCHAPNELYDYEAMANALSSPVEFMGFLTEVSKPAATRSMIQCLLTPQSRQSIMVGMVDPTKMMKAMNVLMSPNTCKNWIEESANFQTYSPLFTYMNPLFYKNWMTAMMHPIYSQ